MHRKWQVFVLGLLALGLLTATPAVADDGALREEVQRLRDRVDALETQRGALLNEEVEEYLAQARAVEAAQGGKGDAFSRMEHSIDFLINFQSLVDHDRGSRGLVNGSVDWNWVYHATDSMDFFMELTANSAGTTFFPAGFPFQPGGGPPISPTLAGLDDGIGVDSNAARSPGGSSINVYQAGLYIWGETGNTGWHLYLAQLDPRRWFQNNAFTADEETQFINNTFIDGSAVPWRTGAGGPNQFAVLLKLDLGAERNMWLTVAWVNTPGRFFDNGAVFLEGGWKGQIAGRDANIALMLNSDGLQDNDVSVGFTFDWWANDQIGVFVKGTFNSLEAPGIDPDAVGQFVDTNLVLGAIYHGPFGSRPDDQLGAAIGLNQVNDDVTLITANPQRADDSDEIVIEVFYRYRLDRQEDKLHVTVGVQIITDPGGSQVDFGGEDTAFLVHVRLHGTF